MPVSIEIRNSLDDLPYKQVLNKSNFIKYHERLIDQPFQQYSKLFNKIGLEIEPNVILASIMLEDAWINGEFTTQKYINQIVIYYNETQTTIDYEDFLIENEPDLARSLILDCINEEGISNTSDNEYILFNSTQDYEQGDLISVQRLVLIEYSKKYLSDDIIEEPLFYNCIKESFERPEFEFKDDRVYLLEELIIRVGRKFVNDVLYNFEYDLYDKLHNLSLLKYEGEENQGQILFFDSSHDVYNVYDFADVFFEFKNYIRLSDNSNLRAIRKLLEINNHNIALVCDGEYICGLCRLSEQYNFKFGAYPKRVFSIKFKGQGCWEVKNEENAAMMDVSYGVPSLPEQVIDKKSFFNKCKDVFGESGFSKKLWDFINEARNQKHGTMVVITDEAVSEADRLSQNSFPIILDDVIDLEFIDGITSIDGAVMLDPYGKCHAIGCILDGVSEEGVGNSSRGARFNSALRYINYCVKQEKEIKVLVVIVSEDGMIDVKTKDNLFE